MELVLNIKINVDVNVDSFCTSLVSHQFCLSENLPHQALQLPTSSAQHVVLRTHLCCTPVSFDITGVDSQFLTIRC